MDNNALINKLSRDMAYAILENNEIQDVLHGVLSFSSCVDGNLTVTPLPTSIEIRSPYGNFSIDIINRSLREVFEEVFSKTYYTPLINGQE